MLIFIIAWLVTGGYFSEAAASNPPLIIYGGDAFNVNQTKTDPLN